MLKHIYDKLEDIPEAFRALYTEKNGKWELTGISGIKTQADFDRLNSSLEAERTDHASTKEKLKVWGDLKPDEVKATLDRVPELEAAADGKLDEAKFDELVNKRVEGVIASRLSPIERELGEVKKTNEELTTSNESLNSDKRTRLIHDAVREVITAEKVIPEAVDDVLLYADKLFEVRSDDNAIVTRDGVGVSQGLTPAIWIKEMQEKRPHWWGTSSGGGGPGTGNGPGSIKENPFSHEHWNMTRQGEMVRGPNGATVAAEAAKRAGTTVGGPKPAPKQA